MNKTLYHSESKDGEKEKLKKRIRKLEKENSKLKSELKTFNKAFATTTKYIKDNTDNFSVESVINSVKKNKTMREMKDESRCEICDGDVKETIIPNGILKVCKTCGRRNVEKTNQNNDAFISETE